MRIIKDYTNFFINLGNSIIKLCKYFNLFLIYVSTNKNYIYVLEVLYILCINDTFMNFLYKSSHIK